MRWPVLSLAIEHHRNTVGNPMTFLDAPWSIPIYKDKARHIVGRKSVQGGWTDQMIIRAIDAMHHGLTVLYVLPGDTECQRMVFERLTPLFQRVELYRKAIGSTDNVRMKKLWQGLLNIVGSQTPNSFIEFSAQMLVIDEYDRCNAKNLALAYDRLAAARQRTGQDPQIIEISNPTIENSGIDEKYQASDAKVWMQKCPACGHQQILDWFKNIVRQVSESAYELRDKVWKPESKADVQVLCSKCEKPMHRLSAGEWVPEHPEREISGYTQSQLFTAQRDIRDMWADWLLAATKPGLRQVFYNSVLGLPYSEEGSRITDLLLRSCSKPGYFMPLNCKEGCIMGVDVGGVFHVHISEIKNGVRWKRFIGTVPTWDEVGKLIKDYNVMIAVIDNAPETHAAKEFRDKHRGVVYLCEYPPNPLSTDMSIDYVDSWIKIDKHQSLDDSLSAYLDGKVALPADYASIDKGNFVLQMKQPVRLYQEFGKGKIIKAIWDERGKPDHHRHADNYEYIAFNIMFKNAPRVTVA